MDDMILTVIVPIFNVEKYLDQCLSSLVNQTDKRFKAILIDDGSTDSSGEIAQQYSIDFPELFTYIYQNNRGLGAARNSGLRITETMYVTFLDSDDWWKPRNAEIILRTLEQNCYLPDVVFTCPTVFDMASNNFLEWKDNEYLKTIFKENGRQLSPRSCTDLYRTEANVCRLVIKTGIFRIHQLEFQEGIKWEDVYPHFAILYWSDNCFICEDAGFIYRINSGGQITSISDVGRLDIVPAFQKALSFVDQYAGDEGRAATFEMLMDFILWFLSATNKVTYPLLVNALHLFAKSISPKHFKAYCYLLHPNLKKKLLWWGLKSPMLYRMIANKESYKKIQKLLSTIKYVRHKVCRI